MSAEPLRESSSTSATQCPSAKKIAYISTTSELGGAEISLLTLLAGLDRRHFQPHVALPCSGPLSERMQALEIPFTFLPMETRRRRRPLAFRRSQSAIRKWLEDLQPSLVHVNSFWAPELAIPPAARLQIPVVYHCRDLYDVLDSSRASAFRACDALIVITECVGERIHKLLPDVRTYLTYNDVDVDSLQAEEPNLELRRERGWGGSPIIGIASRISPDKGQLDFVKAAGRIAAERPDARFLILGSPLFTHDDDYPALLQEEIARQGLADRVLFTGFVDCVASLYKTMDICVLASLNEPFGLVVAEAMACGTAVVATRSGGPQEIITDGVDGLLVAPGASDEIAAACLRLLASDELRKRLARASVETVRSRFYKQEARRICQLYDELIRTDPSQKAQV
ncbi:MAG: glycosyltransferase family 4 protein [Armatimonadetes bacterium]|nr:glycosyltransferase family 4 protein [Armatimonadota bacterium]